MKSNTSSRLKQIMSERNLKQVDILNLSIPYQKKFNIKMGKSTLSQYVNSIQSPDQNRIYLLAQTLGVNEAWLMGFDVPMIELTDKNKSVSPLDRAVGIISELDVPRQEKVIDFAETQLKEQTEQNNKVIPIGKNIYTDDELMDIISRGVASDGTEQTEAEKEFFFNLIKNHLEEKDED